jgi:hypothetical protein
MTEISRVWTGLTSQGAPGDAGAYSAAQWQQTWETWFGQNETDRSVLRDVDNELAVIPNTPADTTVLVSSGAAMVQGIWYYNDSALSVPLASNASGSTRIDVIVLEADYTGQTVRIAVVQGTPGAGFPTITQSAGSIWQVPIAYITLASGFTTIPATLITDLRQYANIPNAVGIAVLNSSGATLEQGSVVIWHASGAQAINTSTTEGNRNVAGVIESRVLNGATGRILTNGVVSVLCDEAVAVGALLEISTTAGQAQANLRGGVFARVLTANTGAGTRCLAYVNVMPDPASIVTGTYTGNAAATQAITGLGFKPRALLVFVAGTGGQQGFALKTDRSSTTFSYAPFVSGGSPAGNTDDLIRSLDADGFTIGDGTGSTNILNAAGVTMQFIALR